jgi:peptidoglycan/xylan/chitin deacetylase (PgdA/CDA1 family)
VKNFEQVATLRSLNVVMFSSKAPQAVLRLVTRIRQEIPHALVRGIVYQNPPEDSRSKQSTTGKLRDSLARFLAKVGSALLRFLHANPDRWGASSEVTLADLSRFCEEIGYGFFVTSDLDSSESTDFVSKLSPHLGIVYGTAGTAPELFNLPREGCLIVRRGRWLDCAGARVSTQEDLANPERKIPVSVLKFQRNPEDAEVLETAILSLEAFDTPVSVTLKQNLIGNDLLIRAISALAAGETGKMQSDRFSYVPPAYAVPPAANGTADESRPGTPYNLERGRSTWNLFLRTVVPSFWVLSRNWYRRWRGSSPVVILFHHLVADRPHLNGMPTEVFLKHVRFLKRHYRVATLNEAVKALQAGRVKEPTVVLTMDDGYRDNFLCLRAVAEEENIPVSLFVSTDYMSKEREFEHDKKWQVRNFFPLTWEQLSFLSRTGFEIGSHTRSHFNCGSTDRAALEREIVGSKLDLEQRLGQPVEFFAFPWGQPENMSPEAVQLAQETYGYFLSASGGVNFPSRNGVSPHLRRRFQYHSLWELELQLQSLLEP